MNRLTILFLGAILYCASAVTTLLTFDGNLGGNDFSITYELNDAYTDSGTDYFDDTISVWDSEQTNGTYIFSDVISNRLTGVYEIPQMSSVNDIDQNIVLFEDHSMEMWLTALETNLNFNYNGQVVTGVDLNVSLNDVVFVHNGYFMDMDDYFADYTGTYNLSNAGTVQITTLNNGKSVNYNGSINTVTISQVPEPCTMALLGIGGLITTRRKRNR